MNEIEIPSVQVEGVPDPVPDDLLVLDVREDDEWASGHLAGALHIPLGDLPSRVDELDPERQTLVMCRVGGRSAQAVAYLLQRGYDVVNLDGGIVAWQQAGRGVVPVAPA